MRSIHWENLEKSLINSECGKSPNSDFCNSHHAYAFCTIAGECWLCKKIVVKSDSVGKALLDDSREAVRVSEVKKHMMCADCAKKFGAADWGEFVETPHSEVVECRECGTICRPQYKKTLAIYRIGLHEEISWEKSNQIVETRCQWCWHLEAKKYEIECERKQVIKLINQVKREMKNGKKSNHDNGAAQECAV